jgi:hypothetical protein
LKGDKRIKVDIDGWAEEERDGGDILLRINPIPLGGVNMFLISGLRPATGVYITI